MKKLLNIVCIGFLTMITAAQGQSDSILVFELFTSQGCSSCPKADKVLDVIKHTKQDKKVFVVSYHVDYWNRLGWKDPFSTAAVTAYQQAYARQFNSRSIYTPQVVVNGSTHFVGSNEPQLKKALNEYAIQNNKHSIGISNLGQTKTAITFQYSITGGAVDHTIFALVVEERFTKVSRGENRNRNLKNTNIVAHHILQKGAEGTIVIPIPKWVKGTDQLSIISYTKNISMQVTGAKEFKIVKG